MFKNNEISNYSITACILLQKWSSALARKRSFTMYDKSYSQKLQQYQLHCKFKDNEYQ